MAKGDGHKKKKENPKRSEFNWEFVFKRNNV